MFYSTKSQRHLFLLLGASALASTLGVPSARAALDIKAPVGYAVPGKPVFITAADLNGDGKTDLITANGDGNTVGVLTSKGNGTFNDAVTYPSGGTAPTSLVTADFNGDGKVDLAVANSSGTTVGLLTGKGDGTFNNSTTVDVGGNPGWVAGGDLNGDGKTDLVVVRTNTKEVATYLSNGEGTFTFKVAAPTGTGPRQIIVKELTGDGNADVVGTNTDGQVGVYEGAGDGTFIKYKVFPLSSSPFIQLNNLEGVASEDFNGNGKNDIAITRLAASGGLLPNVGVAQDYDPATQKPTVSLSGQKSAHDNPASVAIGKVDDDTNVDLVVANSVSGDISVMAGIGNGFFNDPVNFAGLGGGLQSVAVGDFGNAKVSFAAAEPSNNRVDVFINGTITSGGGGTFKPYSDVDPLSAYYEPTKVLQPKGILTSFDCGHSSNEPCAPDNNQYFHPNSSLLYTDAASWVSKAFGKTIDPGPSPDAIINRSQLAKMISDAAGFSDAPPTQASFADVPPSHPNFAEIERLKAHNGTSGYSCGASTEPCIDGQNTLYFRPNVIATRGQGALFIRKALANEAYQPTAFEKQVTDPGNVNLDFHPDLPLKLQLNVTSTGAVTINTVDLFVGFDLVFPLGYSFTSEPFAFELQTSAAPGGDQEICLDVPALAEQLAVSKRLRVFHGEGGILQDRTDDAASNAELLCAKVSTFSPFVVLVAPGKSHGDVNGDGRVDVGDAVLTLQSIVGISTLEGDQIYAADVNASGKVDVSDAVAILRVVVQLDPPFQP